MTHDVNRKMSSLDISLGNNISGSSGGDIITDQLMSYYFSNTTDVTPSHGNHTNDTVPIYIGSPYSIYKIVLIAFVAGVLSIATAGGNLLVMVSFKMDKQLQTVSNYFLLSLSVADFAIGVISMPLYTTYLIMDLWPLGPLVCDIWLSLDYTMSNASVANLLLICFDRYFSISRPLTYRAKRTPKRAVIMISMAWIISVLLWPPWIIAWPYFEGKRTVPANDCFIQFLQTNQYITIFTAFIAFYLPVIIMCILYFKIFLETQKRQKDIKKLQANRNCSKKDYVGLRSDDSIDGDLMDIEELTAMMSGQYPPPALTCWQKVRQCCRIDRDIPDNLEDSTSSDPPLSPSQSTSSSQPKTPYTHHHHNHNKTRRDTYPLQRKFINHQNGQTKTRGGKERGASNQKSVIPEIRVEQTSTSRASPIISPCTDATMTTSLGKSSDFSTSDSIQSKQHGPLMHQGSSEDSDTYTILIRLPDNSSSSSSAAATKSSIYNNKSIGAMDDIDLMKDEDDGEDSPCNRASIRLLQDSKANSKTTNLGNITEDQYDSRELIAMKDLGNIKQVSDETEIDYAEDVRGDKYRTNTDSADETYDQFRTSLTYTPSVGRRLTQSTDALRLAMQARINARNNPRARSQRTRKKRQEKKQDQKAAKTLSAILLAFIVTWTPYNLFTVIQTFCRCEVGVNIYAIGYWLCYINSTINPICYALCNATFRRTYWRILTCRFGRKRAVPARSYYETSYVAKTKQPPKPKDPHSRYA